jgi:hypothetical protein
MAGQPKSQGQLQNLSNDDLENVAGGNGPDLTVGKGENKVFDSKLEQKIGTLTVEGTVTFS